LLNAQGVQQIKGKVTASDDGSALPGASVIVKGTSIATVTDADGNYMINAPSGATSVIVSFVGMTTQEVAINGQTTIDVALKSEVKNLDEVVVTALGISRDKKSLGYATQELKSDEVSTVKTDNFINTLSGKLAGVSIQSTGNMGGSTNIVIRGSKSLLGNNQALFVIDGVPVDNTVDNNLGQTDGRSGYDYGNVASDINPNDIESIDVLKGAASTALYGSRAANGVIMITTKKGSKREGKSLGINISSNVTVGKFDKSTFPTYQNQYGAGYGQYYSSPDYPGLDENTIFGGTTPVLTTPMYEDASYGQKFDPSLMVYQWDAFVPESPNYKKATPWVAAKNGPSYFFQTSVKKTNSIDISNATDKTSYRLAFTNLDASDIMPNSSEKKNSFNFNASYNIASNLKVTASANYVNTQVLGRNSTGYSDNIMSSFRQWFEVNVDMKEQQDMYNATHRNVTWNRTAWNDPTPLYWDNPYWIRYQNYETDGRNRLIGYSQVDWTVFEGLTITGKASVDNYSWLQEERKAIGSVAGELGVGRPNVTSGYSRLTENFIEANYDLYANFKKDITEDFNFRGVVGTNIRRSNRDKVFASTNGGLINAGIYALSNSVSPMLPPEEWVEPIGVNGFYANLSLGYKNFLFLDGSYRIDQSSTLPSSKMTYSYPSISGSFLFSELAKIDGLSLGKIRLNYAQVGNMAPWGSLLDTYTTLSSFNGTPLNYVSITKNNPDLKPEITSSLEGGLTLGFLNNRAGMDLTLYKTSTTDQIIPVSVSRATGYSSKYVNAGNLENNGVELSLNGSPVKTSDFEWSMNINWTRNVSKLVSLGDTSTKNLQIASLQGGVTINARVGEPYGTIQGQDFARTSDGKRIVKANGYYQFTPTSDIVLGNINPKWKAGIQNTVKYKGLSFSFLIDIQQGGSVFSLDQYYGQGDGLYPLSVAKNDLGNQIRDAVVPNDPSDLTKGYASNSGGMVLDGVVKQPDGSYIQNTKRIAGNNYKIFGYYNYPNASFVYDASYVKLREVVLTYMLPKKLVINTFISGASISFVGSNLWIIHKNLPYADPEASQGGGNIQGWQSGVLPSVRNYGFTVNLQF
jgi:TonB-linked SusC/RagA family outer membrane protein